MHYYTETFKMPDGTTGTIKVDLELGKTLGPAWMRQEVERIKARLETVAKLRKELNKVDCDHDWRSIWSDYYSWGNECIKCGQSETGEYG